MNRPAGATQPRANTTAAPRKSGVKWFILLGIVILAGLGGGVYYKNKNAEKALAVTTEKAVTKTITQLVNATGKVQPEVEVKIAPEVAGEVVEMPLREGAAVKKGDLLVSIKADNFRFQVEQQEASLVSAQASSLVNKSSMVKAEEDLRRNSELYRKQLISDADLAVVKNAHDGAKAGYESAVANITRTEGLLSQMRDQLTKATIYSPVDGSVTSRTSEVGERVAGTGQYGGADILRIADLSKMEVRVNINENDIVNVKVGDRTRITIDAYPNRKFSGIVKEIAAAAKVTGANTQDEVTNFLVKIRIVEKDAPLRPGMSANVDVETKTAENVVAVPIQSVTVRSREGSRSIDELAIEREKKAKENQGDGAANAVNDKQKRESERTDRDALQRVVFLRSGDTIKKVPVETGIADTTHMEIKSGVRAGDEIVSGPFSTITRTLKDGAKIRIEQPKKKEEEKK
ncbi:MAG: efflux RND transporter periplasmic adaptor subunit [Opitutus sp.]|nr:efflux RND transporter periplasmic adaptor subunit [Opitutus sp.]